MALPVGRGIREGRWLDDSMLVGNGRELLFEKRVMI
jgi:hypothetical protein